MKATTVAVLLTPLVSGLANRESDSESDSYRFHLDFDETTSTIPEEESRHSRPSSELFELSAARRTLHDALGGTCFLDDETHEFLCSDAVDLPQTAWAFTGTSGGRRFLTADGEDAWVVCDVLQEDEDSPRVFSGIQEDHDGCFEGRLWLNDYIAPSQSLGENNLDLRLIEPDPLPTEDESPIRARQTGTPTPTCNVSPSLPSLAPLYVYTGPANQSIYNADPQNVAVINQANSTLFGFSIGTDFPASDNLSHTCGLQFRFPYCSELQAGYPCYIYSGMEQEMTANSGVYWRRIQNSVGDGLDIAGQAC